MENLDKVAYEQLLDGIQGYVDKCLENSKRDITGTAIIKGTADDGYNVLYNGVIYKNIPTIGGTCSVNETVQLMIPQGEYNNMFILKGGSNGGGGSVVSGVSSVNGRTGDVTITAQDLGALTAIPQATTTKIGGVKVDGTTITVDTDGTIHSASVGNVSSVNGKTGEVVLNATDVGALSNSYKSKIDLWDLVVNNDGSLNLVYNGD